ncbi:gustatory and odorant receptor 24-like [Periplaneta americana]|uniref:gustatory and odorant receptor 24-like n=1 Tax=Periplaneta americana TaxID=6978 RepID=UPI0037E74FF4
MFRVNNKVLSSEKMENMERTYNAGAGNEQMTFAVRRKPTYDLSKPVYKQNYMKTNTYFDEMKPILFILKIIGTLPYSVISEGELIFRKLSALTLYSTVIQIGMTACGLIVLKERMAVMCANDNEQFERKIARFSVTMMYVSISAFPLVNIIEYSKKIRFINDWKSFQAEFSHVTGKNFVLSLRTKVYAVMVVYPVTVAVILFLAKDDMTTWWHLCIAGIGPTMSWLYIWFFLLTCQAFVSSARNVGEEFAQYISAYGFGHPEKISQYKYLWLQLANLTQSLGSSNGITYGVYILVCFVYQVLACYGCLTTIREEINLVNVTLMLTTISFDLVLLLFGTIAEMATKEVGAKFEGRLQSIAKQYMSTNTASYNEVQNFLVTISLNPPVINLSGFVSVNRGLNTALMSQTVTYLIVLIQFNMSSDK